VIYRTKSADTKERNVNMSTQTYQCPCCAAPLSYAGTSGKLDCASCGNAFELEDIAALSDTAESSEISFSLPQQQFQAEDARNIQAFVCQNCGAELMTDGTTTATQCAYCGSPAVLPRPDREWRQTRKSSTLSGKQGTGDCHVYELLSGETTLAQHLSEYPQPHR
jgi:DNA-directed RNA polymerase subunit RPC12/RpoP